MRDLVELVDVMPTIIDLATPAGYPAAPPLLEGISLAPLMAQTIQSGAEAVAGAGVGVARGKTAALTQFPRCVKPGKPLWERNDCDDVPRSKFTHMGLSLRTDRYRYTRWFPWNGTALRPVWGAPNASGFAAMNELYDHLGDDGSSMDGDYENVNLLASPPVAGAPVPDPAVVARLETLLRASFPGSSGPPRPPAPADCEAACESKGASCNCKCFCGQCGGKCGGGCYDKCRGAGFGACKGNCPA